MSNQHNQRHANLPGPPPFGILEVQETKAVPVHSGVELTLIPRDDEQSRGTRPILVQLKPALARQMAARLLQAAQAAESGRKS
ncbi:MAG: hypothetical protein ABL901_01065 [Hyphomicrobiaceae bacterium]